MKHSFHDAFLAAIDLDARETGRSTEEAGEAVLDEFRWLGRYFRDPWDPEIPEEIREYGRHLDWLKSQRERSPGAD